MRQLLIAVILAGGPWESGKGPWPNAEDYFNGSGQPNGNIDLNGNLLYDSGDQADLGAACTDGHSQGTGDVCVGGGFQVDGTAYLDGPVVSADTFTVSGGMDHDDDISEWFGDDRDYQWIYDSTSTQFELNSTDVDGIGTDGVVCYVDDGKDDIYCNGLILAGGQSLAGIYGYATNELILIGGSGEIAAVDATGIHLREVTTSHYGFRSGAAHGTTDDAIMDRKGAGKICIGDADCDPGLTVDASNAQAVAVTIAEEGSDNSADSTLLKSGNAWHQATVNTTGATQYIGGGIGTNSISCDDRTLADTDTVTLTVNGSATVLVESTDFDCEGEASEEVCCDNLGTAVDGASIGVTTDCATTAGTCYLIFANSVMSFDMAIADGGVNGKFGTETEGAPGDVWLRAGGTSGGYVYMGSPDQGIQIGTGTDNQIDILDQAGAGSTQINLGKSGAWGTMFAGAFSVRLAGSGVGSFDANYASATFKLKGGYNAAFGSTTTLNWASDTSPENDGSDQDTMLSRGAVGWVLVSGASTSTAGGLYPYPHTETIADNGGGTNATATITPTSNFIYCDCDDANGCDITMGETGMAAGMQITIVGETATTCEFSDTDGVSNLTAGFSMGDDDSLVLVYSTDEWVEVSRSNN